MGQAKNRGTFEERRAAAIERNKVEAEARARERAVERTATGRISEPMPQLARISKGKGKASAAELAMMCGMLSAGVQGES